MRSSTLRLHALVRTFVLTCLATLGLSASADALTLASQPSAVVRPGSGIEDIVVRGSDDHVYYKSFNGLVWTGWTDLGGSTIGRPTVMSWASDHVDVYARDTSKHLMHRFWNGSGWSVWSPVGNAVTLETDPSVVSWSQGRVDVFAMGSDHQLIHTYYNGNWGNWEALGGYLTSKPTTVSLYAGHLDTYALGSGGALYHRYWASGWSGWTQVGTWPFTDEPAVSKWNDGYAQQLNVYTRGTNGALDENWWSNLSGAWTTDLTHGGSVAGSPSTASMNYGHVDVFARSAVDGTLYNRSYSGSWSGWVQRGTLRMGSDPTGVGYPGHMSVYALDSGGSLIHQAWYSGGWHDWEYLGAPATPDPYPTSVQYGGPDMSVNTPAEIADLVGFLDGASDADANAAWDGLDPRDNPAVTAAITADTVPEACSGSGNAVAVCTGEVNADSDEPLANAAGHSLCPRYAAKSFPLEDVIGASPGDPYPAIWHWQQSWKRYQNGVAGNQKILNIVNHSSRISFNGRTPTLTSGAVMTCGNDLLYWTTAYITEYNDRAGPKTRQYRMYKTTDGSTGASKILPVGALTGTRYRIQFKHRIRYPAEVRWWTGPTPWSKTISCGIHGSVDGCWFEV